MNPTQFSIETNPRGPHNELEAHLLKTATAWCAGKSPSPIESTADFQKRLESEAAWFCKDNPVYDPVMVAIGRYDDTMLFIKPAGRDVRATATIRLTNTPALAEA